MAWVFANVLFEELAMDRQLLIMDLIERAEHTPHLFDMGSNALEDPKRFFVISYVQCLVEEHLDHHGGLPMPKEVAQTLTRILA